MAGYGSIRDLSRGSSTPRAISPAGGIALPRLSSADSEDRQHVGTDRFHRHALKFRRASQLGEAEAADCRDAVAADKQRSVDPGKPVDEPGAEESGGEPGAAFDEESGDAAHTERGESRREIDPSLAVGVDIDQGYPAFEKCGTPDRVGSGQSQDPGWH